MTKRAIAEWVSHLKQLDVQLSVEGEEESLEQVRLRCTAPEGTLTAELRQELADRKAELILYLNQEKAEGRGQRAEGGANQFPLRSPTLHSPSPTPHFPLSFAQQRLWFLYQLAPDNPFYNVPAAISLKGTLDQTALQRSLHEIVHRHAALRTKFTVLDGQPVQVVAPSINGDLAVVNLQTVAVSDRERVSQQLATAEAQRPFNLTTDLLLRMTLLQFDSTESILLLTLHHIVSDGWSLGVLIRELGYFYAAFVEGRSPTLPALPIQYTDFACWQRNWLQGAVLEKQLAYWRKQLQDLPVLDLPRDRPRPAAQTYQGATYPLQLCPTLTQSLAALSQQSGVSLFMLLLAAFQTLLHRYTGQDDIAIGSPIANRHRSEVEGLIGFFVNSLVMRSDLSGNPTFRDLLKRVRNVALAAYEHQDLPFEKLVEELEPERDLSRNPLFQVAFALQNAPMQPLELPRLTLDPVPLQSGSTRFDLEIHLWEPAHGLRSLWQSQAGLSGFIAYSTDLFDRDRIARLVGHFQTLLAGIVADPDARLSDLPLLTRAEYQQIVVEWTRSPLNLAPHSLSEGQRDAVQQRGLKRALSSLFRGDGGNVLHEKREFEGSTQPFCFHHIFEAQVQRHPDAIALVSESAALTYAQLNQQADRLAHTLQQMGVQPGALVGLCVDRSADLVIGILGILKAGAAYVPLDPTYPSDRLQFMLNDTQITILLTQSWLVDKLPRSSAQFFCLDQPSPPPSPLSSAKSCAVTPDSLAYVIYTSGSTGTPKGVLLTHRGLCNVVEAQQQVFHPCRNSRILQFSSLSFDASIFEVALAFGSGGTLYIPPQPAQLPGMALVQFLQDNAITHALLTPAVLAVLPAAELPALQVLITGGEACSSQIVDRWAINRRFFNAYGPTETTIWATVAELHPGDHPLTIGRPILNTQVYLLDANLQPVPVGIPGEVYISGAGLARGYLNRPELTAERFVASPLQVTVAETPPPLLYKTGDRALYHPNGTIQFLGRIDHQIKIRGFRVELGEIEATLQRHSAIRDAVVIASNEPSNEKRLIAYFSLNSHLQQPILQSLQTQHLQHWQTLYNQTYRSPNQPSVRAGSIDNFAAPTQEMPLKPAPTQPSKPAPTQKMPLKPAPTPSTPSAPTYQLPITNYQFNITGWNSSYTGDPIALEAMQEWVSDRVQQILALKPKRVLEIGCGTGLLLFQIAPHCQTYVGTDFSAVSLESIHAQLDALNLPQVKLLHRVATDFESIAPASFDVVILNSIVQYFPSADYLIQVLKGALQAVAPGGVLFVGDVRSLPLLTAFHTWVQFCQADAGMERTQLQQQVDRSRFEEHELAIDPMLFDALRHQFPQIRQVQIRLSRGRSQNEMTQFRYNVLLHVEEAVPHPPSAALTGEGTAAADSSSTLGEGFRVRERYSDSPNLSNSIQNYNWKLNPIAVEAIKKNLVETEPEIALITNVANSRVNAAVKTVDWLYHQAVPKTVGRMRDKLQNSTELAINPQDWWDLETVLPYTVEITWSDPSYTGDYDVLLIRHGVDLISSIDARIDLPQPNAPSWNHYTNDPLQSNVARQLIPELRHYLKQRLPEYMLPVAFVPLATLPITASGKVDRRALPQPQQSMSTSPTVVPSTPLESTLTEIWKDLLRLKQVTIHDNFFELGGHSLLATQMTSRIRDLLGLELPLKRVFEAPTIAQLAPLLETLRDTHSSPTLPPLVRLDRAAHRRQRSALLSGKAHSPNSTLPTQKAWAASNRSVTASMSPLVPLTLGGRKQPFFCVHPMFGVVFPYLELAHHLGNFGSTRSFYGLQPLGLDGKSPPLNRIEAIAAYYIRAIQTLQPQGPYFLGGWSFGGLVAFEMAQQLVQAGQAVDLLAILDTPAPCHKLSFYQSLKFLLGTALWSTLPLLLDYGAIVTNSAIITNRLQSRTDWLSRWQWSAIVRLIPDESRLQLLNESAISSMLPIVYAHSQAAYRYVPQRYSQQLTLFKAAEQPHSSAPDSTLGWSALANDIQLHQVPGNHLSLLKQPHVQILAQELGRCLL